MQKLDIYTIPYFQVIKNIQMGCIFPQSELLFFIQIIQVFEEYANDLAHASAKT